MMRRVMQGAVRPLGMYRASAARGLHQSAMCLTRRVLVSDPIDPVCPAVLEEAGYKVDLVEGLSESELCARIGKYDGLIVRSGTTVTESVLEAGAESGRLRLIGRAGTGVDNIDVDVATKNGIMVMNTPGGNTTSAAELSVSLLMALSRDIPNATASLKGGAWERKKYMGTELEGKTLGVVGLGQIGRRVAEIVRAMGVRTIGYDPLMSAEAAKQESIDAVSLEELWAQSDFISLHAPLTAETRNLLNKETLAQCRRGVRIVNCARGGIIDEAALLEALESGHVAGAALDVYESEPPPESSRKLLEHEHVICTPHLGASTEEAQSKVAESIGRQFVDAFEDRAIRGVVNSRILSDLFDNKDLVPFVELVERLGSLQSQLMHGKLKRVTLATRGDLLSGTNKVLHAAALKGILTPMVEEAVNYINAPVLADEFGLTITNVHENKTSRHVNQVSIKFETDCETREVVGTVFGRFTPAPQPRVVQVDEFSIDMVPEGNVVLFSNMDKPGVIGSIAGILGNSGINIANFALGREDSGGAVGVIGVDTSVPANVLESIRNLDGMNFARMASLAPLSGAHMVTDDRPTLRPNNPKFGSGPCSKRPGYSLTELPTRALGRSHRSALGLSLLRELTEESKRILEVPADYEIAITPGSDTGAFEMAMWNLLGPRDVQAIHFDSFGTGWFKDIQNQLGLPVESLDAGYGDLPDLSGVRGDADVVFTWNGTTSGVRMPEGAPFIADDREGLTLCDATSAVFSMAMPWDKLDVTTYSWQKVLGGEGGFGMMVVSPRTIDRLNTWQPEGRPMPKVLNMRDGSGQAQMGIYAGKVINTPSMLAVEDCLDALRWADKSGGLDGMMELSRRNVAVVEDFVNRTPWAHFLAKTPEIRSNTSVCLTLDLPDDKVKALVNLLADEGVAYDIGAYRDAPSGLRIWCGATVVDSDLQALCEWLEWGYARVK